MSASSASKPGLGAWGALTAQQAEAVVRRESAVVLSSGAGCGKTQVLIARFLDHLSQDGAAVGEIATVTFTDKAAREMRGRIRKAIRQKLDALTGSPSATPDHAESVQAWRRHLNDLESATICTIHSFCSRLLRQYALEAGLDPTFETLDTLLSVRLFEESVRESLHQFLLAEAAPGPQLRELVEWHGWFAVRQAMESLLASPRPDDWEAWCRKTPEDIAHDWQRLAAETIVPEVARLARLRAPELGAHIEVLRHSERPGPLSAARFQTVLETFARLDEPGDLRARLEILQAESRIKGVESEKHWSSKAAYERARAALTGVRAWAAQLLESTDLSGEMSESAARAGQSFIAVALACHQHYARKKRQLGILEFDDLLLMCRDLLRDQTEVRDQIRQRYRFVLIDELQDTDAVQMEIVGYLCGQSAIENRLFAVGDDKQSIYRFRGAVVELFQNLRERVDSSGRLQLTRNFRSQPGILHFTNALHENFIPAYMPLDAHREQLLAGPNVEFLWSASEPRLKAEEERTRDARRVARRIRTMLRTGEPCVGDEAVSGASPRPVRAGDIVLLFRALTSVMIYEKALREQGLDYYLVGGRAYFAQQEIHDWLNLLRALDNPLDTLSLVGALRSPFCALSDDAIFLLLDAPGGAWNALRQGQFEGPFALADRQALARSRRGLLRWRRLKDRLGIAELMLAILEDSGYDAALQFESLGDRKLANLWKLIDIARAFDRPGRFHLADFLRRLEDVIQSEALESQAATRPEHGDNVIRIMSIHQAKGLEFPVVFVPDFCARTRTAPSPCARWDPRLGGLARPPSDEDPPLYSEYGWKLGSLAEVCDGWAEDLRTLYVACTRARDYLVLSGTLPEPFTKRNNGLTVLHQCFDLAQGTCRGEPTAGRPAILARVAPADDADETVTPPERIVPDAPDAARAFAIEPIPITWSDAGTLDLESLSGESHPRREVDPRPLEPRIAEAARCLIDELVVQSWPIPGETGPMLRDRIAALWWDVQGEVRLLVRIPSDTPPDWELGKIRGLLAAWALARQDRPWPREVVITTPEGTRQTLQPDRRQAERAAHSLRRTWSGQSGESVGSLGAIGGEGAFAGEDEFEDE